MLLTTRRKLCATSLLLFLTRYDISEVGHWLNQDDHRRTHMEVLHVRRSRNSQDRVPFTRYRFNGLVQHDVGARPANRSNLGAANSLGAARAERLLADRGRKF